jgi:RimJ/RimL family protein N-acetyltransferase
MEVIRTETLPRMIAHPAHRWRPGHPAHPGQHQRHHGLGYWAAIERSSGEFLGWFGLARENPDSDDAELGYRLRRRVWGQGYATEGARALVRACFTELGVRRVFAYTMAVNLASRRVMEKAGLRHVRTYVEDWPDPIEGSELGEVVYELTFEDWQRSGGRGGTG